MNADSTRLYNRWFNPKHNFIECFKTQVFFWAIIEFVHDAFRILFRQVIKLRTFRCIRPNQAVHVFIQTTRPRMIGCTMSPLASSVLVIES
jgi:hypothetical protein